MTASELYKVIEPIALWKPLFASSMAELLGEQTGTGVRSALSCEVKPLLTSIQAMQTISFVLRVFKSHDEETLRVHLPLIFTALCDLLDVSSSICFRRDLPHRPPPHRSYSLVIRNVSDRTPSCWKLSTSSKPFYHTFQAEFSLDRWKYEQIANRKLPRKRAH